MENFKFSERGATLPLWSFKSIEEARLNIQDLQNSGANSVIIDFHLTTPTLSSSSVEWQDAQELPDLLNVIRLAKEAGLSVAVKPIVIIGDNGQNWAPLNPNDKTQWFFDYNRLIQEVLQDDNARFIDRIILTNELTTLTTDASNVSHWQNIIFNIKQKFPISVGFNAHGLFGDPPGQSEFERIPSSLYEITDFVGISAYPRIDGADPDAFRLGWEDDNNNLNQIEILRLFAEKITKPILFTELGVASVEGGNSAYYSGGQQGISLDPSYSKMFFEGTFSALSQNLSGIIDGVFIYNWLLSEPTPNDFQPNWFGVNFQESKATILNAFSSGLSISNEISSSIYSGILHGTALDDKVSVFFEGTDVKTYGGNDTIFLGASGKSLEASGYEIELIISGDILNGLAPKLAIRVNGDIRQITDLLPLQAGMNSNFGNLPYSTFQKLSFQMHPGEQLLSLEVEHLNDEYLGFGQDRNARVQSISVNGISVDQSNTFYQPDHANFRTGTWDMFDGGKISLNNTEINRIVNNLSQINIDAGEGIDIVRYNMPKESYNISKKNDTIIVNSTERLEDNIKNAEYIYFTDDVYIVSVDGYGSGTRDSYFDVSRFYNTATGAHLYTASDAERDFLIAARGTFVYEGNSFDSNATIDTGIAVFRLYNTQTGVHFYTVSAEERAFIAENLPQFNDEGVAYYAYLESSPGRQELHRFYNTQTGTHFFTSSDAEQQQVTATLPQYWYEGVAYYVEIA